MGGLEGGRGDSVATAGLGGGVGSPWAMGGSGGGAPCFSGPSIFPPRPSTVPCTRNGERNTNLSLFQSFNG